MDAAELLDRIAAAMDARDWDALPPLLHADCEVRFVHTGETFDGPAWVRFNADYPLAWRFVLEDVIADGDRGAGRARVFNETATHYDAMFVRVEDGLLRELVEVWAEVAAEPVTRA